MTEDDGIADPTVVFFDFFDGMNEDDGMTEDDGIADPTVVFFEGMTEDDGMVDGITDVVGLTDVDGLVVGVFFVGLVPVRLLSYVGMNEDDGMTEDDGIADSLTDGTEVKVFFEGMTEDDGMTEDVGFFCRVGCGSFSFLRRFWHDWYD